jgi:hypothetical protein
VRLGGLLTALQPDSGTVKGVLAQILVDAAALPSDDVGPYLARYLQKREPVIAAIAAAC